MENLVQAYSEFISYKEDDIKNNVASFMGALSYFVEEICNSDAESLKIFIYEETKKDLFKISPWIRLIIVQNILLKNPNEVEFIKWALSDLRLFYENENLVVEELKKRTNTI